MATPFGAEELADYLGPSMSTTPRGVRAYPLNDIEATGRCCCNGCIGEGRCDLELGRSDDDTSRWDSDDELGWVVDTDELDH